MKDYLPLFEFLSDTSDTFDVKFVAVFFKFFKFFWGFVVLLLLWDTLIKHFMFEVSNVGFYCYSETFVLELNELLLLFN